MNFHLNIILFATIISFTQNALSYPTTIELKGQKDDHRIVGGQNTTIDKHPHMLSMQYFSNHMCGASVLSKTWALTAAHCFGATDPLMDFLTVRAATSFHGQGGIQHKVKTIIRHEDYLGYDNDIALLELKDPLEFNNMIQPIKIPKQNEFLKPGIIAVAIGWGKTENDDYLSAQLQEVYLFTISEEICMELYSDQFTRNMMCAHYPLGGKDSCTNDSGGPLVVGDTQIGIVSWGPSPCGNSIYPGVYTKVSSFSTWINCYTGI
ncbi:trypsin-7-like [Arctopsyche grandis]|uniref:trypsin-7-like n=1 Tax=Arctopsyche grandis TaxID=121162 RepID=UPI00406D7197